MSTGLYERARHNWALSFTCPHCKKQTSTPISVHLGKNIKLYCDNCHQFMKYASRTEKRFM